jgi:hypothetical protein
MPDKRARKLLPDGWWWDLVGGILGIAFIGTQIFFLLRLLR